MIHDSKSSAGHRSNRCSVGKYDDQKSQISDQGHRPYVSDQEFSVSGHKTSLYGPEYSSTGQGNWV